MTAQAWAVLVLRSTTGLLNDGLSATWSCEDRPCGVCQRKMTTWPVGKLAPAAGAWSDGGGWRVMFTLMLLPRQVAVMVTGVVVVTCWVVMLNVGSLPGRTSTVAGTVAAGELLDRLKVLPTGANPLVRIEPICGVPPVKMFGVGGPAPMSISMRLAGSTVRGAVADWLPMAALSVRLAGLRTCSGRIANDFCPWPAGTTTDAGTAAALGLLLVRATVSPPLGAGVDSCTIPNASLSSLVPLNTWVWLRSTTPPSVNTSMVRLLTSGLALETVKLRAADQAVAAPVSGPDRPWKLRTRQ